MEEGVKGNLLRRRKLADPRSANTPRIYGTRDSTTTSGKTTLTACKLPVLAEKGRVELQQRRTAAAGTGNAGASLAGITQ